MTIGLEAILTLMAILTAISVSHVYLSVGDAMVGMRTIQTASETAITRYIRAEHLALISVITNEAGAVVERLSYDAWGQASHRRHYRQHHEPK